MNVDSAPSLLQDAAGCLPGAPPHLLMVSRVAWDVTSQILMVLSNETEATFWLSGSKQQPVTDLLWWSMAQGKISLSMFHILTHFLLMAQRLILLPDSDNSPETPFQFSQIPECLPHVPGFEQGAQLICSLSQQSSYSDGDSPLSEPCPTACQGPWEKSEDLTAPGQQRSGPAWGSPERSRKGPEVVKGSRTGRVLQEEGTAWTKAWRWDRAWRSMVSR